MGTLWYIYGSAVDCISLRDSFFCGFIASCHFLFSSNTSRSLTDQHFREFRNISWFSLISI
jgi:hypothetical protein